MKTVSFQFNGDDDELESLKERLEQHILVENLEIKDDDNYVGSGYGHRHKIEIEGYNAGFCAMGPKINPYQMGTEYYKLWENGWSEGAEAT
jgi:ribosome modulation factor